MGSRKYFLWLMDHSQALPSYYSLTGGVLLAVFVGLVDHLTGRYIPFFIFYLIPVLFVTLAKGREGGALISLVATLVWFVADYVPLLKQEEIYRPWFNAGASVLSFLVPSLLLSFLVDSLRHERDLARRDPLTGVANRRWFLDVADTQRNYCRRYGHPLSLAYIDLDHFKRVNDTLGHAEGDALLRSVAEVISTGRRSCDLVARLGGDEFALLLSETDFLAAREVVSRVHCKLKEALKGMNLGVSASIGVVTYLEAPESVDAMVQMADQLMYQVKQSGRDGISCRLIGGTEELP